MTAFLVKLGKVNKALNIFLDSRSVIVKEDIRLIVVQGDITIYIDELASLICLSISNAATEFKKMFLEPEHMSCKFVFFPYVFSSSKVSSSGQRMRSKNLEPFSKDKYLLLKLPCRKLANA